MGQPGASTAAAGSGGVGEVGWQEIRPVPSGQERLRSMKYGFAFRAICSGG